MHQFNGRDTKVRKEAGIRKAQISDTISNSHNVPKAKKQFSHKITKSTSSKNANKVGI